MKGKQIIRKGFIKDFLWMTLGISLLAVGIYFFKIPNGFSTGGVSGMGTVLGHLLPWISPATWIAGINLLLLILGFLILGWKQMAKTIYCSLLFSAQIWLLELLVPLSAPLTDQPFLELI
ncbi:MAG: YitT family protein, partial [Oscillospiraceae bacterium]|nr:YitT family protein [Oscillospiraceae bacterium]